MSASLPFVVAIDGPAGAGKSTVARRLAVALGFAYLDTGAMYRAVTFEALRRGVALDVPGPLAELARHLPLVLHRDGRVDIGGEDVSAALRSDAVNAGVSVVAAVPEVREVMVGHQRRFAQQQGRIVAEGRDIGSVVFPDAAAKIYLDADPGERARRRLAEAGGGKALAEVQAGLERRDRLDSTRATAPLVQARGAVRLDTTHLTLEQVVAAALAQVRSALSPATGG
ncbi:MAG: (d)CMP kinase [Planctomycetia bacterium]